MKISFVKDGGFGLTGADRTLALFARWLVERGHSVHAVAKPRTGPGLRGRFQSLRQGQGWSSAADADRSHFEGVEIELKTLDSQRAVRETDLPDADVVIATGWESAQWVWQLLPAKGAKIHFVQDYETWSAVPDDVDAAYFLPLSKIVSAVWLRDLMQSKFQQAPMALIPSCVHTAAFNSPVRGKQPVPTVGLTYDTQPHKGSDLVIEACRLARKTIPELRVVACGTTKVSSKLPLPENASFDFCATDERLRELYSGCDAWLYGSRKDGFGLPILEAMACRTPVIGTPAGAAPELLRSPAGVPVKAENPAEMARGIVEVCQLPEPQWQKLSAAAHARAAQYAWDKIAPKFEAVLLAAVKASPSRPHK